MAALAQSVRDELFSYETADPVVAGVLQSAWGYVAESDAAASLDELHLCLVNPAVASARLKASPAYTENCAALRDQKLIVVNERFMLDLETAIRSFAQSETLLGCPYLKSDGQLLGLLRRMEGDYSGYLVRLRRSAQRSTGAAGEEQRIRDELALVMLFFIGHELGHFMSGHATGQFGAFVDPRAPLEQRIDDAVVKLCRHVDEFAPTQFGLPGFEKAADAKSDVRGAAAAFRARDERRYERQEAFFANEAEADAWANRMLIAHLDALSKRDRTQAETALHLLCEGLFVAALYTWYRDLDVFARKLGAGPMSHARDLALTMVQSREQYIHAATLFGDHHRFTLLRAALALEAILRARTDWFDHPVASRTIWHEQQAASGAVDPSTGGEWRLCESLQRYFLLCICMDTAVKIAHVGCATGWIRDADRKRGTKQLLLMNFEGIDEAVSRLKRLA